MITCQKCKKTFPFLVKINGEQKNLAGRKFCLDCSPYGERNTTDLTCPRPSIIDKLPDNKFASLVSTSISRSEILFRLKMRKSGASFSILNRRIKKDGVDVSHFKMGCFTGNNRKYSNEDVYVRNSKHKHIRDRVLSDKIMEYKCSKCEIKDHWNNEPLTLELDHINGDRHDNRKENLRWLCPNCHSQTTTFCAKRRS